MFNLKSNRYVGIELLRIIAMLMVFNLHFFIKGQYNKSSNQIVNIESWIVICFSVVAVNCYVLISGYFMVDKSFKLSRLTNTYSQMWFYSVATFVLMIILGYTKLSIGNIFLSITPFIHNSYWFVTSYLLLLLFTPLLNSAINNMSKSKLKLIIFLLVGVFSVFNNVVKVINPIDNTAGYRVLWFIVLYLSAAYLKKYYIPNNKPLKWFVYYGITVVLNFAFHTIFGKYGQVWEVSMVRDYNNILVYAGAMFLFLLFININITSSVVKNIVLFFSPLTFAVYLIHESPFVYPVLWKLINVGNYCTDNALFIFMAMGTIILLFIAFCLIELARQLLFKLLKFNKIINNGSMYIESKVKKLILRSRI